MSYTLITKFFSVKIHAHTHVYALCMPCMHGSLREKNSVINVCLMNKSLKFGKDQCFGWEDDQLLVTM